MIKGRVERGRSNRFSEWPDWLINKWFWGRWLQILHWVINCITQTLSLIRDVMMMGEQVAIMTSGKFFLASANDCAVECLQNYFGIEIFFWFCILRLHRLCALNFNRIGTFRWRTFDWGDFYFKKAASINEVKFWHNFLTLKESWMETFLSTT